MGLTITEKIIARAAGRDTVKPGEIVGVTVDRLMINDLMAPVVFKHFSTLEADGIVNPERIIIGLDHRVPPATVPLADTLCGVRKFCRDHALPGFGEIGRHGVGHQLMCEDFTLPGEVAVGTDSHATMYGGLGALACGVNASDAAVIMACGKMWMRVPHSVKVTLKGQLRHPATAKDLILRMQTLDSYENFIYRMIEIAGEGAHTLSVDGRLVVANMAAEMEAKGCIFPPDEKVMDYLKLDNREYLQSDEDAAYERKFALDLSQLEPLVACPHNTNNIKTVKEVRGLPIQQAFLGSCTNGRLEDLEEAAEILKDRRVHPDVRLIVVPASQKVFLEAARQGLMEVFLEAGAAVMLPSCASCAGNGPGMIGKGERCISTTNRNWKGRMGSPDSEVFLASPYTVAASAIAGCVEEPGAYL